MDGARPFTRVTAKVAYRNPGSSNGIAGTRKLTTNDHAEILVGVVATLEGEDTEEQVAIDVCNTAILSERNYD